MTHNNRLLNIASAQTAENTSPNSSIVALRSYRTLLSTYPIVAYYESVA
jgi:hypothetical protein